ncbi:MAG: KGK domain protein [Stigonema ocellatum SAG 48.90 = DSM 106950]|nr:KGK domain protein [Stigonema ocellatum SAG 48.90 = DSM 106950]
MKQNFCPQNCDILDVFSSTNKVFKISQFQQAIREAFGGVVANTLYAFLKDKGVEIDTRQGFEEGVDCEVLKVGGKGWQKGKFRITATLQFIPDEPEIEQTPEITQPESPLDDIRRIINEATT